MKKYAIVCLAAMLLIVLIGCRSAYVPLDAAEVQNVTVWEDYGGGERQSDNAEREEFISLYNKATFGGKAKEDNPTPAFGFGCVLADDSVIWINQRSHNTLFVTIAQNSFYLESAKLYAFAENLNNTLQEVSSC